MIKNFQEKNLINIKISKKKNLKNIKKNKHKKLDFFKKKKKSLNGCNLVIILLIGKYFINF